MHESYHAPLPKRFVWLRRDYPWLMRILSSLAHNAEKHSDNRHLRLVLGAHSAEAQYALLMHYYKVSGVIQRSPGSHNYRPLKKWEEDEILRLYIQGIPKLQIAKRLNRHVSTVFYFLRRAKLSVDHEGSTPSDSIAHAQIEQGHEEKNMNETTNANIFYDGQPLLTCGRCGRQFPQYDPGTPPKKCPTCKDIEQERPSVVQTRKKLHEYDAVQIEDLPAEWVEVPPQHHGDAVHFKQTIKGSKYGASWQGRIDLFAAEPFKQGDVVNIREMCSEHKIKVLHEERQTMHNGTVTIEKELPITSPEGDEVIRQRRYLVLERAPEGTQAQSKLVFATAHTKTTLKGLGRQYWASAETQATIANWQISGGYRSGRASTTGVFAIVNEEHPLYIKKTGDIEGEECYK